MEWIILAVCFLVFIGTSVYHRTSRIVVGYDIRQDEEDKNSYSCKFKFNGYEQKGYFFYEGEEIPEIAVLKIIGVDCTAQEIEVELMNGEKKQVTNQ